LQRNSKYICDIETSNLQFTRVPMINTSNLSRIPRWLIYQSSTYKQENSNPSILLSNFRGKQDSFQRQRVS